MNAKGFFINAAVLLLFGLLLSSLAHSHSKQRLLASAQARQQELSKADAIAAELAYGMKKYAQPEAANSSAPGYAEFRQLAIENLSRMMNAEIWLPETPLAEPSEGGAFIPVKIKAGGAEIKRLRIS